MTKRTKFVILAIVSLYLCFGANIVLSTLGKEQLSDAFCIGWIGAFTVELAILAGIKIKSIKKGDE